MKSNRLNFKVLATVLAIALSIPFVTTFFSVEASNVNTSVSSNMSKYGFTANANNLTITTTKELAGYTNASDANNRSNATRRYPAGNYFIFNSVDGALNLSRTKGTPGAWINARDLASATPVASSPKPAPAPTKQQTTPTTTQTTTNAQTFVLKTSATGHTNADDAMAGRNPKVTLGAGTYYVYKTFGQAVNLSTRPGTPGAWVNTKFGSSNVAAPKPVAPTPAPKPAPKPVAPTPAPSTPVQTSGKVTLNSRTPIYTNAADAVAGKNNVGTWPQGTYFIYKTFGNATNITGVQGKPGAWVSNTALSGGTATVAPTPAPKPSTPAPSTPTPSTGTAVKLSNNQIRLDQSVKIYTNAADAIAARNNVGTWSAGTYFIYKTYNGAINITTVQGSAGAWIYGNVKQETVTTPSTPSKPTTSQPSTPVATTPSNPINSTNTNTTKNQPFVLVFDPGHGGGSAHNRGGVLFNEGDQNFYFTNELVKAAQRYANVVTKTTRTNINEDPSMEDRANAGDGADLYLSIHTNASSASVRGTEIWGSNSNTSHEFAKDLTSKISTTLNTPNRGVKYDSQKSVTSTPQKGEKDTWWVFKDNEAKEKYIVETVFHTNLEDSRAYLQNQAKLANLFMDTIARHFNLQLK